MNNIYIIIIIILIILNIISFVLGFILSKLYFISGVNINKSKSFFKDNKNEIDPISIDDKIYITDIKTDGIIKKYEKLGEVKKSEENITSSVDKLKKMKG